MQWTTHVPMTSWVIVSINSLSENSFFYTNLKMNNKTSVICHLYTRFVNIQMSRDCSTQASNGIPTSTIYIVTKETGCIVNTSHFLFTDGCSRHTKCELQAWTSVLSTFYLWIPLPSTTAAISSITLAGWLPARRIRKCQSGCTSTQTLRAPGNNGCRKLFRSISSSWPTTSPTSTALSV